MFEKVIMEQSFKGDRVIPSLKWIFEEGMSKEGAGDFFLQAILNRCMNMKIYLEPKEKQEKFVAEALETLVKHNREIRKMLKITTERSPVGVVKIDACPKCMSNL